MRMKCSVSTCPVQDHEESIVIDREFEFARILRQHILPRAASAYTRNYFIDIVSQIHSSNLSSSERLKSFNFQPVRL